MKPYVDLPLAVAGLYQVLAGAPTTCVWCGESIDLRTVTIDRAADLVRRGFPYLIEREVDVSDVAELLDDETLPRRKPKQR